MISRTTNIYNLQHVDILDCEGFYPSIRLDDFQISELISYHKIRSATKPSRTVHFFINDYQFERVWKSPVENGWLLKNFNGAIAPEFSMFLDMPLPMIIWNEYRKRALMHSWQTHLDLPMLYCLNWAFPDSYEYVFKDLPKGGVYAVSTVGCVKNKLNTKLYCAGMEYAEHILKPKKLIVYGPDIDYSFNCEIQKFYPDTLLWRK